MNKVLHIMNVCVSVVLVIQHVKCARRIILSSVAWVRNRKICRFSDMNSYNPMILWYPHHVDQQRTYSYHKL